MFSLPKMPTVETFGVSLDTLKVEGALTAVKDKVNESTKDAGGIFDNLDKLSDVTDQMDELKAQVDGIIPDIKPELPLSPNIIITGILINAEKMISKNIVNISFFSISR